MRQIVKLKLSQKKKVQEKEKRNKKKKRLKKKRTEALPENSRYKTTKNHGKIHLENRYAIFNIEETVSKNISYPSYGCENYNYLQKDINRMM